jgi:hypothetical protein
MLFNTVGYRFVFSFLEKKSTTQLDLAIDQEKYNPQNLIEIKIPLNMPYFSDKDYEAAYGETEIDGIHYQYVKRKVSNNTLYLLCLPNSDKTNLIAVKNNIEKTNSEARSNKSNQQNPVPSITKSSQQEYLKVNFDYQVSNEAIVKLNLPKTRNSKSGDLFTALTPTQPPEFCI